MPACIPGKCRCFSAIYFRLHTTDFTFAFRCLDYFIRKILGRFLVLLVHALIGFVVFVALTIVLPYESLYKSKWFLYVLVVFAVYLLVNIFYHYHKARNTPPGSPPKVLREPLCRHCNSYKPYGTHHCSICNECVLQMDHHCVWVNTCIGAQNHRHFFQFLIFLIFGCATFVVAASNTFYFNYWHPYTSAEYCSMRELEWLPWFDAFCANEIARFVSLAMLFTYFLCVIIFFLVGSLFYWNFVLISAGFTYIELLQQQQLRWRQLVNIIFCPLSNSDFACNWRRFLGLKLGSGRSFWRHILLPSAHCTFIYEGEFGHTLEQVRVHENMLFQPGSRRSHTALPFFVPTSNVERGCDEESTSKTNISEALPLQRTIV